MDISVSLSVVFPICLYMVLGALAKKLGWLGETGIAEANKVVFHLLFPVLMFNNVMKAGDAVKDMDFKLLLFCFLFTTAAFLALCLIVPLFVKEKPAQASLIQGMFRGNSLIFAIPIVSTLCGEQNTALVSLAVAVIVPYYNLLGVLILELKRGNKPELGKILKSILANPIIIGAIAGLAVLLLGLETPPLLVKPLSALSGMVTPLALLLLGAGLRFSNMRKNAVRIAAVCVVKLIVLPLAALLLSRLFGFEYLETASLFAMTCVPTAVSSYTMAAEMNADAPLAGEIVAVTSALSVVTVFVWVLALTGLGIL